MLTTLPALLLFVAVHVFVGRLQLSDVYLAVGFSFIAGGVIMNVLKEELPEDRGSSLVAFLGGVVAYAVLLAAT